jgi:hypothetical protein
MSRPRTRWEFVKEGIAFGIGMAVLLSLLVTLHSLARGTFHYEEYGVSTWAIVGAYCVAGASAGPLVGLLRGSAMRRSRAVMLGVAGGVIVYGVVAIVLFWPAREPAVAALVVGSLVGGLTGWRWSDPNDPWRAVAEGTRHGDAILRVSRRRSAARNRT